MKKPILTLIVITTLPVLALLMGHVMTLGVLQEDMAILHTGLTQYPFLSASAFFFAYVLMAAFSLPGAALMTLASGALFGLGWGTLISSLASSVGALFAFLASRYLFRDSLHQRWGERLKSVDEGMRRDGAFYLFTLRLVPLFPFFLVNILMGLSTLPALTFYLISQIGMLPGTIVYVNAGTQLSTLHSISGIMSVHLWLSFALLGFFPWIARRVVTFFKQRKLFQRWQRPSSFDRNVIVIGAGAAGLVSSYIAATVKAKVTLIEGHRMGGDCLNYGCVPSKALIRSAKLTHQIRHADRYGLLPDEPKLSFRHVMQRVQSVIREVAPHDSVERYTALGVEVLQGQARLLDPWTVEIRTKEGQLQRLTTRSIILATGAAPTVPSLPGLDNVGYLTSDTLWEALAEREHAPGRLIVLGGGPIGCELAQAMARLGSQVTQIERSDRLIAREDQEVSIFAQASLEADGIQVLTEHAALHCERNGDTKILVVEYRGQHKRIEFDELICAVGRSARLTGYGLEELGIPVGRTILTNEYLQTVFPHIYAAGDVAGPYQFTHVAAHQAWYATVNALFGMFHKFRVDYRVIPWTTFIDPEVARVGLNEQEAQAQGIAYELTRYGIDDLDRAMADGSAHGFIKILTSPGKDKILGVTIVGEHAGDLLAEFVLAMRWGLGLNKILSTIHTYPTLAEANKYAAGTWKREHAPQNILRWLERLHRWQRGAERA